jgi:hypothetical protein
METARFGPIVDLHQGTSEGRAGGDADIRIELLASKTAFTVYAILAADVRTSALEMCRQLLTNPAIEIYAIEIR